MLLRFEGAKKPKQSGHYRADLLGHLQGRTSRFYDTFLIQTGMRLWEKSHIGLSDQKDRFGMRRVKIALHIHPDSWRSMEESLQMAIKGLGTADKGRLAWPKDFFNEARHRKRGLFSGHHHLCSTRMSESPKTGVVDADLRLFGLDNLYVCSASAFSTPGCEHPTMTIVALALRLADHIQERI